VAFRRQSFRRRGHNTADEQSPKAPVDDDDDSIIPDPLEQRGPAWMIIFAIVTAISLLWMIVLIAQLFR